MAKLTQSEDTAKVYKGIGWDVVQIDGHDLDAIQKAVNRAKKQNNGRPKLIIARTLIGISPWPLISTTGRPMPSASS